MRGDGSVSVARVVHPALAKGASDLALALSPKEASVLQFQQGCQRGRARRDRESVRLPIKSSSAVRGWSWPS